MLGIIRELNAELVAGGIVGLTMVGVIIRNVLLGWYEAHGKMKAAQKAIAPLTTAVALSWDRDQIERVTQTLERIAEALEISAAHVGAVAEAQGILSDNFQLTTQQKLDKLLDLVEHTEREQGPRHLPRHR